MKKQYINPKMRIAEMNGSAILAASDIPGTENIPVVNEPGVGKAKDDYSFQAEF